MAEYLTYKQAGALVKRSPRTIRYWKSQGMDTSLVEIDGQMVRVVEKATLQAWFRQRLMNWPTHKWRLRKKLAEEIMRHADEN